MNIEIDDDSWSKRVFLRIEEDNTEINIDLTNYKSIVEESTIEQLIDGARKCSRNNGESELYFLSRCLNTELASEGELLDFMEIIKEALWGNGQ